MNNNTNDIEKWQKLTISNDFIFCKVMSDKEICKEVLEVLLERKVGDIKYIEQQKTIDLYYDYKGIRLDVYVEDETSMYNLEMQASKVKFLNERARFYQSAMDVNSIPKGVPYGSLKESFIIFICKFDNFGHGYPLYKFENICLLHSRYPTHEIIPLNDKIIKIYLNSKAYEIEHNPDIKAFLQYVETNIVTDNPLVKKIDKKVKEIKNNSKWRDEYMTLKMREKEIEVDSFDKGREEGRQEGIEEGIIEGLNKGIAQGRKEGKQEGIEERNIEIAKNMLRQNLSVEMISSITGLSIDEINNLK